MEKRQFSTNGVGTIRYPHGKGRKLDLTPRTFYNYFKIDHIDRNVKCKTLKLLAENIQENLYDSEIGREFLDIILKHDPLKN